MKAKSRSTVLVQTRVPKEVAKWMGWHARMDGNTVAGWLRTLLIREKRSRGRRRVE